MAARRLFIEVALKSAKMLSGINMLKGGLNLLASTFRAVFRTTAVVAFFTVIRQGFMFITNLKTAFMGLLSEMSKLNLASMMTASVLTKGTSATAKAFQDVSAYARKASTQVAYTAIEIQEGLYTAAIAGYDLADSIKLSETAMKMATVGQLEFKATINSLIGVTKAFGMELKELPEIADIVTAAFTHSKMTLGDFFTAVKYTAAAAVTAFGESRKTFIDTAAALMVLNNAGLEACYDKETEVLTKQGWKNWEEVTEEDIFATVTPKTKEIEYDKATKLIKYKYKGKMYVAKNNYIDVKVTPNHRMFVRPAGHRRDGDFEVIQAQDLNGKSCDYMVGGLKWKGVEKKYFTLPAVEKTNKHDSYTTERDKKIPMKIWVEFLGYYLSEGSSYHNKCGNYEVVVAASKRDEKIEKCLIKLGYNYNYSQKSSKFFITNKQLFSYLHPLGKAHEKYIPQEIKDLPSEYLKILYEAYKLGDGDESGRLYTSSPLMKKDLEEIILKCGWGTLYHINNEAGYVSYYKGKKIISRYTNWQITANKKHLTPSFYQWMHKQSLEKFGKCMAKECWEDYDDFVYCAEVPNGLLIVRRGRKVYVCGNSKSGVYLRGSIQKLVGSTSKASAVFAKYGVNIYKAGGASQKYIKTLLMGQIALDKYYTRLNSLKQRQLELSISGRSNSQAFSDITNEISELNSNMSTLESGLGDVYEQFTLAGGKLKDFSSIISEAAGAIPVEVLGRAFGIRGGQAIQILMQQAGALRQNVALLEEYENLSRRGQSILSNIFGKVLETVLVKWGKLKNTVLAIFSILFEALFEPASKVMDSIWKGLEKIYKWVESNKKIFKELFKGLGESLSKESETALEFLLGVVEKLKEAITGRGTMEVPMFSYSTKKGVQVSGTKKVTSTSVTARIGAVLDSATSLFVAFFEGVLETLSPVIEALGGAIGNAMWVSISAKLPAILEFVGSLFSKALDIIEQNKENILKLADEMGHRFLTYLKDNSSQIMALGAIFGKGALNALKTLFSGATPNQKKVAAGVTGGAIGAGIGGAVAGAPGAAIGAVGGAGVGVAIGSGWKSVLESGLNMSSLGYYSMISNMITNQKKAADTIKIDVDRTQRDNYEARTDLI